MAAPTTAAFDKGAFSSAFFSTDVTPVFGLIRVDKEYRRVKAGSSVTVTVYLDDVETTPGRRFAFNAVNAPQIQVYNPDGTIKQAYTDMFNVELGVYEYQHVSLTGDSIGAYSASFKAVNGGETTITPSVGIFE